MTYDRKPILPPPLTHKKEHEEFKNRLKITRLNFTLAARVFRDVRGNRISPSTQKLLSLLERQSGECKITQTSAKQDFHLHHFRENFLRHNPTLRRIIPWHLPKQSPIRPPVKPAFDLKDRSIIGPEIKEDLHPAPKPELDRHYFLTRICRFFVK